MIVWCSLRRTWSDRFLREALGLVRDFASYRETCIEKARRFSEGEVLGALQARIEAC